ncbi:putative membrane protein [Microbacterium esteraromaticum]|uniref:Putative membrane protein n=1 Tax=Microbacterium esteraromaticum TaxID=57043 RepID=A0A1R4I7V9_9MICO|nr:DUF2207 domain-containing protein [Microbacterium esteraromaticum]SJN15961.1 putative membrane protein [Microbacterium esteraromaticum]
MLTVMIVLGLLPALAVLTLAVLARVRPAQKVSSPGPRFAAADGATVVDDALLLDADGKAPTAVLIDLAIRRKINLLVGEATGQGEGVSKARIGIEVADGAVFTAAEAGVLEALFPAGRAPGAVRRFSSDGRQQRRTLREVFADAEKTLADAGLIVQGRAVWPVVLLRVFGGIGIAVTFLMFIVALSVDDGRGDALAFCAAFLAMLIVIAGVSTVPHPWRRFRAAAQPLRAHLAGMREYIALAETDSLNFVQSTEGALLRSDVSADARELHLQRYLLNERLLPYAVLFGLEKSWVEVLKAESVQVGSLIDAVDATVAVLEVIEIVGGVAEIASAVGDLVDTSGNIIGGIGEALDVFS